MTDIMVPTLAKRAAWSRVYGFEFADFEELEGTSPATISSATVTGTGLTVGTPSVVGTQVHARISGGTAGQTYTLTCDITTSGGDELTLVGRLYVAYEP